MTLTLAYYNPTTRHGCTSSQSSEIETPLQYADLEFKAGATKRFLYIMFNASDVLQKYLFFYKEDGKWM
jgi:hypothetical protein